MSDTLSFMLKSSSAQMMNSLAHILNTAKSHAVAHEIDEAVFLNARLFPDMFPLLRQVQVGSDILGRGGARVSGIDMPSNPDTETSIDELVDRAERVNTYVQALDSSAIDANERVTLNVPVGKDATMPMEGRAYVSSFVLPNVHFHVTTAYALLRHQGVKLGKRDFLMGGQG
jgi:hypothetical protein